MKGEEISIKILESEYLAGLEGCINHLHGRVILAKGEKSIKVSDLQAKLTMLWKDIGQWNLISSRRGFYEFSFSSIEDLRCVQSVGLWNLKPGNLRLFSWTKDFNPNVQQVWVRFFGLPQEYWRPKTIFAIAGGLGIPTCLDEATSKGLLGILQGS